MSTVHERMNYYEILEIEPGAAQQEVLRAYQRAKQNYSQDNPALYGMFSKEEAREILRLIEEAYSTLSNITLRRRYDDSLLRQSGASPAASPETSWESVISPDVSALAMVPDPSIPGWSEPPEISPKSSIDISRSVSAHTPPMTSPAFPEATVAPEALGGKPTYTEDLAQEFAVRRLTNSSSETPTGMGRTPLSTYPLDSQVEREISTADEFSGAFLQKIRTYKRVSLEGLAETTRISRTYLLAVETEDFAELPAAVFVRGFVVQVSRILGLDPNRVAASYMKRFKSGGGRVY